MVEHKITNQIKTTPRQNNSRTSGNWDKRFNNLRTKTKFLFKLFLSYYVTQRFKEIPKSDYIIDIFDTWSRNLQFSVCSALFVSRQLARQSKTVWLFFV